MGIVIKMVSMENTEVEKSKGIIMAEIIEYVSNAVVIKTILKKTTGNISILSLDAGENLKEQELPFDKFIQIIDGRAEILIDGNSHTLENGHAIIIPAHAKHYFKALDRFKMISTIIKSGYE